MTKPHDSTSTPPRRRPAARRLVVIIATAAWLAGCAAGDAISPTPPPGYAVNTAARLAAVDWSKAETVTVELSEYRFTPDHLTFRKGGAYRLILRNRGTTDHTFVAPGFFQAIAVRKLMRPEGTVERPYVAALSLAPGAQKELDFVAVRPGDYPLECTVFLHEAFGMEGDIEIQ